MESRQHDLPSARRKWTDIFCLTLIAAIVVITVDNATWKKHIRAITDNDAVGYTTAARSLAETGQLTCHIIYPSTLLQGVKKTSFYMPGFYGLLAGTYKVFGFGVKQSLAVSGVGYVLATLCTYLICLKFFDRLTSLMAAGFFMVYPGNLYYCATVMTESSLVAVAAVAFCIFLHLPRRWKPFGGPLLLVLPFIFRETGAFLALPMAMVLWFESNKSDTGVPPVLESRDRDDSNPTIHSSLQHGRDARVTIRSRSGRGCLLLALSVIVLGAVYKSPLASGRPSLVKLDIFIDEMGVDNIYRNAHAADRFEGATVSQWIHRLWTRAKSNVRELGRRALAQKFATDLMLLPLLTAVPLGFAWGAYKRDVPALCAAALLLVTLTFICACYTPRLDRPVRVAMFAFPFVAILHARLSRAFFEWIAGILPSAQRAWPAIIGAVAAIAWVSFACFKGFEDMREWDMSEERAYALVEEVRPDDSTVLVAPHLLGVPYINRRYPATFSFVPANRETLELLCAKYPVGMVIHNPDDALDLKVDDILALGFKPYRKFHLVDPTYLDGHYEVYRRPDFWGEEGEWDFSKEEEFNWSPRRRAN